MKYTHTNAIFIGDVHLNYRALLYNLIKYYENTSSVSNNQGFALFQVGDFGLYPTRHSKEFRYMCEGLAEFLEATKGIFFFIDGNHEDHSERKFLEKQVISQNTSEPIDSIYHILSTSTNIRYLDENGKYKASSDVIRYIPRSTFTNLAGLFNTFFLGGAYGFIEEYQEEGETIDQGDIFRSYTNPYKHIDVMVTHEIPYCPYFEENPPLFFSNYIHDPVHSPLAKIDRVKLGGIKDKLQPKLIIHGHHHQRYTLKTPDCTFVGLGDITQGEDAFYMLPTDLDNL